MKSKTQVFYYEGQPVTFSLNGMVNVTEMCKIFGKKPIHWERLPDAQKYIAALCKDLGVRKSHLIKTYKGRALAGSSTPENCTEYTSELAMELARWLSPEFSIWCNRIILNLPKLLDEWKTSRADASGYYRIMSDVKQQVVLEDGGEIEKYTFSLEAELVKWAATGFFKEKWSRDELDQPTLSAIATLEVKNSSLLFMRVPREERKKILWDLGSKYPCIVALREQFGLKKLEEKRRKKADKKRLKELEMLESGEE